MKTIWGFDLGIASVGSAAILTDDNGTPVEIRHMGSRTIPMSADERNEFSSGNAISKNAQRTRRRNRRKGYDRYQMRRATLITALKNSGLMPDQTCPPLDKLELWSLRSRAAAERVTLPELGRVLLHLNQKRGYKSARAEGNTKEDTDYVKTVNRRYEELRERGLTVGQYLFGRLSQNRDFRIRDLIYPQIAYKEEFNRIMTAQRPHYPDILTEEFIRRLRDDIIYRQRPLKSCKGLVAVCEFEGRKQIVRGHERLCGPKVAPRSSPLAQECRIWEQLNNIRISDKSGQPYMLTPEQKEKIAVWLGTAPKITWTQLQTLLGLRKNDGWNADRKTEKQGLVGNETYSKIAECFGEEPVPAGLLDFPLAETPARGGESRSPALLYDRKSGEVLCEEPALSISPEVEQAPLYRLWHTIYSIADIDECAAVLVARFRGIDPGTAQRLAAIDFTRQGFSNKSAKAMRRILPYLRRGYGYSDAMALAGYNHSGSLTTEERRKRPLKDRLDLLPRNALRQPVVEKVLGQLVNLTNALLETYGRPDEIRIELARELKQSQEERERSARRMNANERENKRIAERIAKEHPGLRATRRTIQKYKLHQELAAIDHKCIYCNQTIRLSEALSSDQVDIDHIIPQSLLFDDSMSNKILSHHECNHLKDNRTAYDFMKDGPFKADFAAYLERVDLLCAKDRTKRNKLLMAAERIPTDFIDRQLRQSQYIARKAVELLQEVCTDVRTTSGSVTAYLRRTWGWEEALMQLQLPRYRGIEGATEWVEYTCDRQTRRAERIVGWSKRDDHRHQAIDALAIACTRQGYIQRLNTLSREKTRREMMTAIANSGAAGRETDNRGNLLERYITSERPFTPAQVQEKAAAILVSVKPGKRVTTPGVRKAGPRGERRVAQRVLVPRGPLSEESVYGCIPDPKTGKPAYVIRYPLGPTFDKTGKIVDPALREAVRAWLADGAGRGEPFRWNGQTVRSVRCYTGLTAAAVEAVRYDPDTGLPLGFVKPGNNHHIAFYRSPDGKRQYRICTFWQAVERKRMGLPVIVRNPDQVWNKVLGADTDRYTPALLGKLPPAEWAYEFSLQQNEMVLLGLDSEVVRAAIRQKDHALLSRHLYRLQSIGQTGYKLKFRHHAAATADKDIEMVGVSSFGSFDPVKVRIDLLGQISETVQP
ncbi:MAG: type II CRISPR RNA-guided endonuclease Cas9 [Rikenellaceae bacterium]|nr:type II CRISPR RNA-guided endonuclease Cas9 [Rikenellaceae bacterium]